MIEKALKTSIKCPQISQSIARNRTAIEKVPKKTRAITAMIFEVIIWCISCRKFEARAFICFIDLAGAGGGAEEELLTA